MLANEWLDIIGLIFALIGAIIIASGLIIGRTKALKVGVSRIAEDSEDKNI
ncbi:MAG: hypothetical protein GWN00_39980, partial [Aliifodinibius sp.]|nr:hypothetical protein [Fodinibius sp.]NIV13327.1 hypothetical protein [Fodinibius sp.]NIY30736.1 hypothetical protein [Fodinibius sp.]